MVKLILSYVKVEDYHHCLSFKAGSESIIRFFMQFRLDAPKLYKRAIRTAATSGFLGIIDTIPDDISSDGITGLLTPLIEEGRADILYYLIKKDIKIGMRHVGNYMGNSLGVFKYLIKDITYPLQELMYEYAVDLSRNPNERIFDLVYEIASKYKKDVPQMIVGAIKSRNAKNFWKIFLNTDWGPDYHVLNKLIEENGVRLPDTSDEIFYAVLPYIKSLSDLAARCVMSDRIDLFEAVHSIIRERGQASEGFYTRILSTAIVRSNVKLARRLIELGAHISTSFSDSITSMEMLLFLETKTVITRNAYKRLLYNALSHGLIVLAKHCYEKVGFLITGKTMKGWIRNIQVTMATSRFLLDRGADPNILFKAAVRSRDLRSVKLAFERGATNIASVMNNAKRRYTSDYLDKVKELLTK
jgi:hypothetical protein